MDSTEERPAKRRCTRDPPEGEEEEDGAVFPSHVRALPTWVPPSLLQLCYRTLRAMDRIQELEKDGRIPQETLQKFEKWVATTPCDEIGYNPWQDCGAWGADPQCDKCTGEEKVDSYKTITVLTRVATGARACVHCLKGWQSSLQEGGVGAISPRIHLDYEGNYPEHPGPVFNEWKGPWGRISVRCHEIEVTGYVPGKTTEDDLTKCVENACRDFPDLHDFFPEGWLVSRDLDVVAPAPNDQGPPPIFDYYYESDDDVEWDEDENHSLYSSD